MKQTKRETFRTEMEAMVPWDGLIALIELHYPKTSKSGGCPMYPQATMLRIYHLQQCYSLSDPDLEETLIKVPTMRRFTGTNLVSSRIPDETTILAFLYLRERNCLGEQIFVPINTHLSARA